MLLRVNKRVGMWGFDGIWLTFADRRPVECNLETLPESTKSRIITALDLGILFEVDKHDMPVPKQVIPKPIQQPVVQEQYVEVPQVTLSQVQTTEIIDLLEQGVRAIRLAVGENNNKSQLAYGIDYEANHKNRSSVLKILRTRLTQLSPGGTAAGGDRLSNMYGQLIEEDKPEVITIEMKNIVQIISSEDEEPSEEMV